MYEDPSPEPSRGGLIARLLAAVGCVAAGVFAYLWLAEQDALRLERDRVEAETEARAVQVREDVARAVREQVNKDVAAERARHARELAALKASRGTALEQQLEKLGAEHDRLLGALGESRERSHKLKGDAMRLVGELEVARRDGAQSVRALGEQLHSVEAQMTAARLEAEERERDLQALEGRMLDPLQGPLAAGVAAHVTRVLDAETEPDPRRLRAQLGNGVWLFPFLASHFLSGARGVRAAAAASTIADLDVGLLVTAVARSGRTDEAFSRWIGAAMISAAAGAVDEQLKAGLAHESIAVRLATVEAAHLAATSPKSVHAELVSAIANPEPEVSDRAIARVAAGSPAQRATLAGLVGAAGPLSAETRATIWRRLMEDAEALLPELARVVAENPEYIEAARGGTLGGERRQALVGELLAHPREEAVDRLLERFLEAPDGEGGRTAWAASVQGPELRSHVLAAARRVSGDEVRARARALLPTGEVDIIDPVSLLALAPIARPVHLPFLVASAHRVSGLDRIRVARALFRLGHPVAVKMIEQASDADDPAVRAEAVAVAASDGFPDAASLVVRHLYEGSPVREAAIAAVATLGVSLPPEMTDLLLSTPPPWTSLLLDGFARHEQVGDARHRVMELLQDDLVIDADGAALWAFTGTRRPSVADCKGALTHAHSAVRARALEAWRDQMEGEGDGSLVRTLEPFTKDKELRVRVQATRLLSQVRHDLARTTLVVLAKDPSEWVREAAYRGLGFQHPYHVVPVLRSGLHDKSPYVCNAARLSLLVHGMKDEAPVLFRDSEDPLLGFRTRRALDQTLGVVGGDPQSWAAAVEKR
ncbi:MAG: hypothetical protein CMJ90_10490 [Planctomycetes bacterium]|nr:hypothetical protein [Planctomycetota bacterium]